MNDKVIAFMESLGYERRMSDSDFKDDEQYFHKSRQIIREETAIELYQAFEKAKELAKIDGQKDMLAELTISDNNDPDHELDIPDFVEYYLADLEKQRKELEK